MTRQALRLSLCFSLLAALSACAGPIYSGAGYYCGDAGCPDVASGADTGADGAAPGNDTIAQELPAPAPDTVGQDTVAPGPDAAKTDAVPTADVASDAWVQPDSGAPDNDAYEGTDADSYIGYDSYVAPDAGYDGYYQPDADYDSYYQPDVDYDTYYQPDSGYDVDYDGYAQPDVDYDTYYQPDTGYDVDYDWYSQPDTGYDTSYDADTMVDPWSQCPDIAPNLLYASTNWVQGFAIDSANIYWTALKPQMNNVSYVQSMPLTGTDGASPKLMVQDSGTYGITYEGIAVDIDGVYFSSMDTPGIWSAPLDADGTSPATQLVLKDAGLKMGANQPRNVARYGGQIYWIEQEYSGANLKPGVRTVTPDGTVSAVVEFANAAFSGSLFVDDTGVYVGRSSFGGSGGLLRIPIGSTTPQTITSDGTSYPGVVGDGSAIYWTQTGNAVSGNVMRANLPGVPELLATVDQPGALVLDAETDTLYFATTNAMGQHAIFKMPKTGGAVTPLVCGLKGYASHLEVDGTTLYFSMADGTAASYAGAVNAILSVDK